MSLSNHDPIKAALGSLTIGALKHALQELPGVANDPAWQPLEDCVIEVIEITDTQATVKVAGHGAVHWYNVVIQTQRSI